VKGWDQLTFGQMVFNQLAFGPNDVVSSAPIYLYQSFFSKSCIEKKTEVVLQSFTQRHGPGKLTRSI
jgi:hypothetical protein